MLDDNKIIYELCATTNVPNWKKLSRSDLCRKYISTTDQKIKDGCVSAIICKDWGLIGFSYLKQPYIPIEEWYDTILDAILYVLDTKPWEDENSKLYNDPKGPEKALHRCIFSRRLNTYLYYTRDKRKVNKNQFSIDKILDETLLLIPVATYIDIDKIALILTISEICKENSETGILLDLLSNNNYSFPIKPKLIVRDIQKLNETYAIYFSETYDIDIEETRLGIKKFKNNCTCNYIENIIHRLRTNESVLELLSKTT